MEDWELAVQAAHSRKALDLKVLHIGAVSTFTDHFIICTGTNGRQVQAIADAVQTDLKKERLRPMSVEGFQNADWILLDYGDFVFHVFSPEKRTYYDLERLWRTAPTLPVPAAA
jgi:ribosome-associated protein